MEEVEVTLGQRTLASVRAEQTTAAAYAGLGMRHLMLIADGADGPVPSRLAAQVATSATLARFRASLFPHTAEQLEEAFHEAHQAVRRGALGSHAEGGAGASMIGVVIEAGGVTAARIGGGRVYLITGGAVRPLFRDDGRGTVGDGETRAETASYTEPLPRGARIILMTEAVARAVVADVDQLAGSAPAQLAAGRLADAARRRGQYAALAVQVVEVQHIPTRPGPHPAVGRLQRGAGRTLSADGRWLGSHQDSWARARRTRGDAGWILWFFIAVILGAGAALIAQPGDAAAPPEEAAPTLRQHPPTTATPIEAEPDAEVARAPTAPEPTLPAGLSAEQAQEIAAIFAREPTSRASRALRNYITRRYARDGEQVFADLEAWILARNDPEIVATLVDAMQDQRLRRTHRWISELLPRLFERSDDDDPQ